MDDLTHTHALDSIDQLSLNNALEMSLTETDLETRFAHLFHCDLPLPITKKVITFVYPTQQKKSTKRQAPAPPKSKLKELEGINNYHLRTIQDLGPILTRSATIPSITSCSVDIVVNPMNSARSLKLRTFCSDAELVSNLKVHKKTPPLTKEGEIFRKSLIRNDKPSGDFTVDASPSKSQSDNFPTLPKRAFERSCGNSRKQISKESYNSVLFYDYDEFCGPKEEEGDSRVFSCVTSQEENAFSSLPPACSPSLIQRSPLSKQISSHLQGNPSRDQVQPSHAMGSQSLVQNSISTTNGASHLHCVFPCVQRISSHSQGIVSPNHQGSLACIQDNLSCATNIPLSIDSLRVSNLETEKHILKKSGGSNFDNDKLAEAENRLENIETDCPYYRTRQISEQMCEEVDDGMSDRESVQSSHYLSGVLANNPSIHPQEDVHKIYRHEKMENCSEKKVPPPKPPRIGRGIFTKFCEADVPSLIEQESNCKKVNISNDDVSDDGTPLKPPRNKCKFQSNLRKPLTTQDDARKMAFCDPVNLNHKQEEQVVENLALKRPERLRRRPVVGAGPQQRQSFRAKQHKTKKCSRKFSFPVKFSVSLKSSLGIFRMSGKHHTSKALGERPCKNNSISFKSWLCPKSSAPSDLENFHIPRIILHLEPSDVVRDDSLELKTFKMNEQHHRKTSSSVSSLIIPDPLSYDKDDLSTLDSLKRIYCSQSSLHYANKQISSPQLTQQFEEHQEHTEFRNENSSSEKNYMLPSLASDNVIFMNTFRYEERDY